MLGIAFVSMALKAHDILPTPQMRLGLLLPRVLLPMSPPTWPTPPRPLPMLPPRPLMTLSTLVGRSLFARDDAIALVFGTVMRNL